MLETSYIMNFRHLLKIIFEPKYLWCKLKLNKPLGCPKTISNKLVVYFALDINTIVIVINNHMGNYWSKNWEEYQIGCAIGWWVGCEHLYKTITN
jgi:hypothetical protein